MLLKIKVAAGRCRAAANSIRRTGSSPNRQQVPKIRPPYRNDPDIALEGNFDNPTLSDGSLETDVGGTSYAAPRLAGLIALANRQAAINGTGDVRSQHLAV